MCTLQGHSFNDSPNQLTEENRWIIITDKEKKNLVLKKKNSCMVNYWMFWVLVVHKVFATLCVVGIRSFFLLFDGQVSDFASKKRFQSDTLWKLLATADGYAKESSWRKHHLKQRVLSSEKQDTNSLRNHHHLNHALNPQSWNLCLQGILISVLLYRKILLIYWFIYYYFADHHHQIGLFLSNISTFIPTCPWRVTDWLIPLTTP